MNVFDRHALSQQEFPLPSLLEYRLFPFLSEKRIFVVVNILLKDCPIYVMSGDTGRQLTCKVCERPATGREYNVATCGSCRAFYKRTVGKKIDYTCLGVKCSTLASSDDQCMACRFRKIQSLLRDARKRERLRVFDRELRGEFNAKNVDSPQANVTTEDDSSIEHDIISLFPAVEEEPLSRKRFPSPDPHRSVPGSPTDFQRRPSADLSLIPFTDSLEDNLRRVTSTVFNVRNVVESVWGGQLDSWMRFREDALQHGTPTKRKELPLEQMLEIVNAHNGDSVARGFMFATMLPGARVLPPSLIARCIEPGWKELIYWTIHHGPFMTDSDTHIVLGPQQVHYSKYWQDTMLEPAVVRFIYRICAQFRDIGLDQTERYLLMIVVMFEPDDDHPNPDVSLIHRHYSRVLLDVLKWRCSGTAELTAICKKLEDFFCVFKLARSVWSHYAGDYYARRALEHLPPRTSSA